MGVVDERLNNEYDVDEITSVIVVGYGVLTQTTTKGPWPHK